MAPVITDQRTCQHLLSKFMTSNITLNLQFGSFLSIFPTTLLAMQIYPEKIRGRALSDMRRNKFGEQNMPSSIMYPRPAPVASLHAFGLPGVSAPDPGSPGTSATAPGSLGTSALAPGPPGTSVCAPSPPGMSSSAPGSPRTSARWSLPTSHER